MFVKVIN